MRRILVLAVITALVAIGVSGSAALMSDVPTETVSDASVGSVASFPSGTWNSGVQVQNLTGVTATVSVDFYNAAGTLVPGSTGGSIPPNGAANYYLPNIPDLASGRYAAVVSSDQQVAAVVNQTNYSGAGLADAYLGISSGSTSVSFPLIFRNYSNWTSLIAVQNTSGSSATDAWLSFYPQGSAVPSFTKHAVGIPANAGAYFDLSDAEYNSMGTFLGSLSITSTQNIAAVVNETKVVGIGALEMFGGFTSTSTRFIAPLVFKNYSPSDATGWTSGLTVQNKTGIATTVYMTFTASNATGTYVEHIDIAANSSGTFYMPSLPAIPNGLYGSAVVASNNGAALAVLVSTTKNSAGMASGYNAFPTGAATTSVVVPQAFKQYSPNDASGWTTGIQVFNTGATAATVNMTYTGTNVAGSWTKQLSIPGGTASNFYLPNYNDIPAGSYGSVTVESTSNPILVIASTTKYQASVYLSYTGINQ